jgi:hypothetical protein
MSTERESDVIEAIGGIAGLVVFGWLAWKFNFLGAIGISLRSPPSVTCETNVGVCQIESIENPFADSFTVTARISGEIPAAIYGEAAGVRFVCKAFTDSQAFVGEGADYYSISGNFKVVAKATIFANARPASIACTWG